ncbi:hypothetical protein ACE2AJ_12630 [Aquihabitans daechungensis]|uniref:hypothetical protein n=1 Tax=Aquihabitans daechungensis TaxID=1052257 RepID=UPI003B9F19A7
MISDVGEEPGGVPEIRDETGLVVGSPAWLELQRLKERRATSSGIKREGMWRIAAGGTVVVVSLLTTLTILTSEGSLDIELSALGYVLYCVVPLLIGVLLIIEGLRRRGAGPGDATAFERVSAGSPADPGPASPPEAPGPGSGPVPPERA